jgi:K+-sensing histidine kinase KdpD
MERDGERLFYLGAGPTAALLLGAALVPLRELTPSSNLAFAFVALTVAVAEFGGRAAAFATAISSALSLNFFLTRPYLTLAIHGRDDLIAFLGLAGCGLFAAGLAAHRADKIATLTAARKHRDLLHAALSGLDPAAALEPQLTHALRTARDAVPLAAVVVRDTHDRVLAGASAADTLRPVPAAELRPGPLPEQGARIRLVAGAGRVGWLDVWGAGGGGAEAQEALADLARLAALLLAGASAAPARH